MHRHNVYPSLFSLDTGSLLDLRFGELVLRDAAGSRTISGLLCSLSLFSPSVFHHHLLSLLSFLLIVAVGWNGCNRVDSKSE